MSMKKSSLTIIVVLCCALSGVCQQVTIQEANEASRPVGHVTITIKDCFLDYLLSIDPERFYSFFCKYETGKPNCTNVGPAY